MSIKHKLAIIGLGTHGRGIARLALSSGFEITSCVDPFHAGEPLSALLQLPSAPPVIVFASVDEVVWDNVEVAIVAIKAAPEEVVEMIEHILIRGVNVITIVEDLYDLQGFAPELHHRLNATALASRKTVIATGVQDAAWAGLTLQATALVRDLRS